MMSRIGGAAFACVVAFAAGWLARFFWVFSSPASPPEWTTVRVFTGELSKDLPVVVRISYSRSYSTGLNSTKTFLQNKIQIDAEGRRHEFRWADDETYAASCADVVDLDQDGRKEFVLSSGGSARVVSFEEGKFVFRAKEDELFVPHGEVALIEERGERYFVVVESVGNGDTRTTTKKLARWASGIGFSTVVNRNQ